jgi:hypothetical protein
MLDKPCPCSGVRLASIAMEPASSPQGAVARDNGMIATAPRRNALRGKSESDITPFNQRNGRRLCQQTLLFGLNNLAHLWEIGPSQPFIGQLLATPPC